MGIWEGGTRGVVDDVAGVVLDDKVGPAGLQLLVVGVLLPAMDLVGLDEEGRVAGLGNRDLFVQDEHQT